MKYLKGCLIVVLAILLFGCQNKSQTGRFVPIPSGSFRMEGYSFAVLDTQTGRIWMAKYDDRKEKYGTWVGLTDPILSEGNKSGS